MELKYNATMVIPGLHLPLMGFFLMYQHGTLSYSQPWEKPNNIVLIVGAGFQILFNLWLCRKHLFVDLSPFPFSLFGCLIVPLLSSMCPGLDFTKIFIT